MDIDSIKSQLDLFRGFLGFSLILGLFGIGYAIYSYSITTPFVDLNTIDNTTTEWVNAYHNNFTRQFAYLLFAVGTYVIIASSLSLFKIKIGWVLLIIFYLLSVLASSFSIYQIIDSEIRSPTASWIGGFPWFIFFIFGIAIIGMVILLRSFSR